MSSAPPPPAYGKTVSSLTLFWVFSLSGERNSFEPHAVPMQTTTAIPVLFGEYPVNCKCPQCGQQIITRIEKNSGLLAWLLCLIMFFFVFWICCFIPFCVDACKVCVPFSRKKQQNRFLLIGYQTLLPILRYSSGCEQKVIMINMDWFVSSFHISISRK